MKAISNWLQLFDAQTTQNTQCRQVVRELYPKIVNLSCISKPHEDQMKHLYSIFLLSSLLLINFSLPEAFAATERASLNLEGARVVDLATSNDGSVTYAACEGSPYGLYYSTDFGGTWTLATGGSYSAGAGKSVVTSSTRAYALVGSTIYTTLLSAPTSWSVLSVGGVTGPSTLLFSNGYLFIGNSAGQVYVYKESSSTLTDTSTVSSGKQVNKLAYDPSGEVLFVQTDEGASNAGLFESFFNSSTGALSTWTDFTTNVGTMSHKFKGIASDGYGRIYVSTFNAGGGEDGVYRSTDGGMSFTRIITASNAADASFQGTTYLVGSYLSTDDGMTWNPIASASSDTPPLHTNPNLNLLNPTNAGIALVGADVGLAKTTTLTSAGTFVAANSGLLGTTVRDMAQLSTHKDRVFVATNTQFAYTDDFTSSSPTWQFPILPLNDGSGSNAVGINPANDDQIFAANAHLYSGAINDSVSPSTITWTLVDDPTLISGHQFMQAKDVEISTVYTGILFVAYAQLEGTVTGMLRLYDVNSSFAQTTPTALDGKPVNAVKVVASNLVFVATGSGDNKIYLCTANCTATGGTWTVMSDTDLPSGLNVTAFSYNSNDDKLYAAASDGLYILSNVGTGGTNWSKSSTLASGAVTAVATDTSGTAVYAAVAENIYESTDGGSSWTTFYSGLPDEQTSMLYFDALVQGSNTGFYSIASGNRAALSSPAYGFWNSSVGGSTVLELSNPTATDVNATVTLLNPDGTSAGATTVVVSAQKSKDVLIHELSGYSTSPYGMLKIEFTGELSGQVVHYEKDHLKFAYLFPLENASTGTKYANFNVNQPSSVSTNSKNYPKITDAGVSNYLALFNEDAVLTNNFEVSAYDAGGNLLNSTTYAVGAHARFDVPAGQNFSAKNGWLKIVPSDSSLPYQASMIRHGASKYATRSSSETYEWLVTTRARGADEGTSWVSYFNSGVSFGYIELTNLSNNSQTVTVEYYDLYSGLLGAESLSIPAQNQRHWQINRTLTSERYGYIKLTSNSNTILADQLSYLVPFSKPGLVTTVTAISSLVPLENYEATRHATTWNNFYVHANYLHTFNTDSNASVTPRVSYLASTGLSSIDYPLRAETGRDLDIGFSGPFNTPRLTTGNTFFSCDTCVAVTWRFPIGSEYRYILPIPVR